MKSLYLLIIILLSKNVFAETSYACNSESGLSITLNIVEELNQITWWNHTNSTFVIAKYEGIDTASTSEEFGYKIYFASDDELSLSLIKDGWFYKIEPNYRQGSQFKVIEESTSGTDKQIFYCQ